MLTPPRAGTLRSQLADALLGNAIRIGTDIQDGEVLGIRQREEGITEGTLLNIARTVPQLRIVPFNHDKEAGNGADWEWWVSVGPGRWFHFVVQAKKWQPSKTAGKSPGYYNFAHEVKKSGQQQVDLLMAYARDAGAYALYTLYNPAALGMGYSDHRCCLHPRGEWVTAVSAGTVQHKFGPKSYVPIKRLRTLAIPWSCLTDPGVFKPGLAWFDRWGFAAGLMKHAPAAENATEGTVAQALLNNFWRLDALGLYEDTLAEAISLFREGLPAEWTPPWSDFGLGDHPNRLRESRIDFYGDEGERPLPRYVQAALDQSVNRRELVGLHPLAQDGAAPDQLVIFDEAAITG